MNIKSGEGPRCFRSRERIQSGSQRSAFSSQSRSAKPSKLIVFSGFYLWGFRQRSYYGGSYRVKDQVTIADLNKLGPA